ncbi:MAG: DUF1592 domain-containing protein [Alphaproteobacteria bacterium]|nr:DUF1592 domain-containing protein [Alphaproteobacteria bacterium]
MPRHLLTALLLLGACDRGRSGPPDEVPASSVRGATMHRLTEVQWRNAVEDLLGVAFEGELPADYVLYNFAAVGAGQATVAPYELEQYESAAWAVAELALPDATGLTETLGCAPAGPLGREDLVDDPVEGCVRPWLAELARDAWRRPVDVAELDDLVALYSAVDASLDNPTLAARASVAMVLLSPHFLFRVERGAPEGERRRYTDHELAARLAFFLTDRPPDAALAADADDGRLSDPDVLREHAERLLATDAAQEAFGRFFAEWMALDRIALVDKDPTLYPWFDATARSAMDQELRLLFQEIALDEDADLRTLLTTDIAYVDATLAGLYGVPYSGPGFQRVRLPAELDRGGLMGRMGILSLNAHSTLTSPTLRGKFVRNRILCQDIPPPPEGVLASLDEVEGGGTLRDQLEQHMTDPTCASCHQLMDPVGFALEHFDAAGQRRELDNGQNIDASATIEGQDVYGATELGAVLAAHERFGVCVPSQLWRDALGVVEETWDQPALDALAAGFADAGYRFEPLVIDVVTSEPFRYALEPDDVDAPAPHELCDGADQDADGAVDEGVVRACEAPWGRGLQECSDGRWLTCVGPWPPPETCDGVDNDDDGAVDEALGVDVWVTTDAALVAAHSACDPDATETSGPCNAAVNRTCAANGCAVTGFGPVAQDDGAAALSCLDATEVTVLGATFGAMAAQHGGCVSTNPVSPDCNAAINRWCASQGLSTGFGPLEHAGEDLAVACTPNATRFSSTYTALSAFDPACDGSTERMGRRCDRAMHQWCRAQGYATGFGPLENSGDVAYVACLGTHEGAE